MWSRAGYFFRSSSSTELAELQAIYEKDRPVQPRLAAFKYAPFSAVRGAGEILFTSMDHDGTKNGFANDPLLKLHNLLEIPVIASGGAGTMGHFIDTFVLVSRTQHWQPAFFTSGK